MKSKGAIMPLSTGLGTVAAIITTPKSTNIVSTFARAASNICLTIEATKLKTKLAEETKTNLHVGRSKRFYVASSMVNQLTNGNVVMNNSKMASKKKQRNNQIIHHVVVCTLLLICLMPCGVQSDENNGNNGFSLGPEITTTEFDYASRGNKKFGDKCESTQECSFAGSVCDPKLKHCQCDSNYEVTNHIDKCGKTAAINETCFFNEQCESFHFQTECRDNRCICRFEMSPIINKDGTMECKAKNEPIAPIRYVDPAMIGVLVGMALMFVIICVVLRLFSRARWRENRTIFNTPNPRLMNVSLLRDSKLLHGQERRGSRMSVRVPSRQPSMASLRPHSPNPSLGKRGSRRGSRGSSNASATSTKSNRSVQGGNNQQQKEQQQPLQDPRQVQAHITNVPGVESITVEIVEPKA